MLYVSGVCGCRTDFCLPTLAGLQSLTLDNCYELNIHPQGGAKGLKNLEVLGNDAIAIFSYFANMNPEVVQTLDTLRLRSEMNDYPHPDDFTRALQSLELKMCLVDVVNENVEPARKSYCAWFWGPKLNSLLAPSEVPVEMIPIPQYLPKALEHFSFHGPPTTAMLRGMPSWIEHAINPEWLPNLKSITFVFDQKPWHPDNDYPAREPLEEMEHVRQQFLSTLISVKKETQILSPDEWEGFLYEHCLKRLIL